MADKTEKKPRTRAPKAPTLGDDPFAADEIVEARPATSDDGGEGLFDDMAAFGIGEGVADTRAEETRDASTETRDASTDTEARSTEPADASIAQDDGITEARGTVTDPVEPRDATPAAETPTDGLTDSDREILAGITPDPDPNVKPPTMPTVAGPTDPGAALATRKRKGGKSDVVLTSAQRAEAAVNFGPVVDVLLGELVALTGSTLTPEKFLAARNEAKRAFMEAHKRPYAPSGAPLDLDFNAIRAMRFSEALVDHLSVAVLHDAEGNPVKPPVMRYGVGVMVAGPNEKIITEPATLGMMIVFNLMDRPVEAVTNALEWVQDNEALIRAAAVLLGLLPYGWAVLKDARNPKG